MTTEMTDSRLVFKGKVFDVTVDHILEGDSEYDREIVRHKGSSVILPLFDDGTVALVRQYRHPAGRYLLELPAGTLNAGEDPEKGALRELEEEIGVRAAAIEKIAEFWVSPGFLTEKMFLYLATELTESKQSLDDDENIEIERIALTDAVELISNGTIQDAKTIVGLLLAAQRAFATSRGQN